MVLVDTSVWIDFFQSPAAPEVLELEKLIKDHNRVVLCGVVLQEVLQGIRSDKSYQLVRERLLKFPYVSDDLETWLLAAEVYRQLRREGITLPPVDVTIAAIAIRNDLVLFSRDSHFETVARYTALRLHHW